MSAQQGWLLLAAAGILEVAWASILKQSNGLSRLWPSLLAGGLAIASFAMLAVALRALPLGTGYIAWVGIGSIGVALVGVAFYGEPLTWLKLLSLALVIAGIAGLKVSG